MPVRITNGPRTRGRLDQTTIQTQGEGQKPDQRLRLNPLLQESVRIIRLSHDEFMRDVEDKLDNNPALEQVEDSFEPDDFAQDTDTDGEDDYPGTESAPNDITMKVDVPEQAYDYNPDDRPAYYEPETKTEFTIPDTESFYNDLMMQAAGFDLTERQEQILEYLIRSLDDDGLLRKNSTKLSYELDFKEGLNVSKKEVEEVMEILKKFEPAGIGTADLRENLIIQVRNIDSNSPVKKLVLDILTRSFDHFKSKHRKELMARHKIDSETLDNVYSFVSHLNPRPIDAILSSSENSAQPVTPDFVIHEDGDTLIVGLYYGDVPEVVVSQSYANYKPVVSQGGNGIPQKDTIQQQVNAARQYIKAIEERHATMLNTMKAIVEKQEEFFHTGDRTSLVPMIEKDIADVIKRDDSVVSGVVANKYADTPFGIVKLSDLFNTTFVNQQGQVLSREAIKQKMLELIKNEDKAHPLDDETLAPLLGISRRTVAAYRQRMNIPIASQRK